MQKKYLTAGEVEEMIGIKEKTLANWRSQGKGPQYYKAGRIIRYSLDEVERWMSLYRIRTVDSFVAR
jgi:predicted DNA-binding transcriptional regulator AlpA